MAKQISACVGGVIKKVAKVTACIGGVVKEMKKGVCCVGGAIKTFFEAILVLYDNGTNYAGLVAKNIYGYTNSDYTSFEDGYIYVTYKYDDGLVGYTCFYPNSEIDISDFKTFYVTANFTAYYSTYQYLDATFKLVSSDGTTSSKNAQSPTTITKNSTITYEFDISSFSGIMTYVEIQNDNDHYIGPGLKGNIYKMWFE